MARMGNRVRRKRNPARKFNALLRQSNNAYVRQGPKYKYGKSTKRTQSSNDRLRNIQNAWNKVQTYHGQFVNAIENHHQQIEQVSGALAGAGIISGGAHGAIMEAADQVKNFVGELPGAIMDTAKGAFDGLLNGVESIAPEGTIEFVEDTGEALFSPVYDAIVAAPTSAIDMEPLLAALEEAAYVVPFLV